MPIIDELERLADLYDAGELTDAEYRAAKAAIVAEAEGPPSLTRAAERRLAIATIVVAAVIALLGIAAAALEDDDGGVDTVAADDTLDDDGSDPDVLRSTVSVSINLPGATLDDVIAADKASSTSTSTTVEGAATSTTAASSGGEAAVKDLWAAYKAGDRAAAGKVAVKAVVDSLFQVAWSAPDATAEGCTPSGDRVRCVYVHKGERITFTVEKNESGAWMVVAINYTRPGGTTTSNSSTTGSSSASSSSTASSSVTIPAP